MGNETAHWTMVRFSALGDALLTTGVMHYLARRYGHTFTVVTKKKLAPIFEHHPDVTEIIGLEGASLAPTALADLAKTLSADHSGLLDFHSNIRSRIMGMFWTGEVRRYPKFGLERRLFLLSRGHFGGAGLRATGITQRYAMTFEQTPPPSSSLLPIIWLTDDELLLAETMLHRKTARKPLIALHPYATHANKAWPIEFWHDLGQRLSAQGVDWIVIGNDPTPVSGMNVEGNLRFGVGEDFTNGTTLRETAALLAQTDLLVTGDSGPMHLASAVGTPVVAIFGPTTREWGFFPCGPNDITLEPGTSPVCRPCSLHGNRSCRHNQACMRNITPTVVAESVFRILGL